MMNVNASRSSFLTLIILILFQPAFSATPQNIHYQGVLTNAAGLPVTGTVDIEIRLYDSAISGTQLYSENHLSTNVVDGVFNLSLGSGSTPTGNFNATTFANNTTWLEMIIDSETQTPRHAFLSVPYALHTQSAVDADHATSADSADSADDADTLDGNDSSAFALTTDLDWGNIMSIPADIADGDDDSGGDLTGVTAGGGVTVSSGSGPVPTISHSDTSSAGNVNGSDGVVLQDLTLDTYGHLTGSSTIDLDSRYYTEAESNSNFAANTHDHFAELMQGNNSGDTGLNITNLGSSGGSSAVKGVGALGPTLGYLGVQGETDFDGISGLGINGLEVGVLGVSTGNSNADNYGLYGFSNDVGVYGEGANLAGEFVGDISVTGDVQATSLTYASAKSFRHYVHAAQFDDRDSDWDAYGDYRRFNYSTSGSATAHPTAPVNLPDGVTITNYECYFYDQSPFKFDYDLMLYRRSYVSTATLEMAEISGSTQTTTPDNMVSFADSSITSATVDNSNYSYYIGGGFITATSRNDTSLRFYGCVIDYQMTEIGH